MSQRDATGAEAPLRILVLTMYFWPESFRITELVRALRAEGAQVSVLTGQPNYPDGVVFPGYRAGSMRVQQHPEGYTIYRVPHLPRGKASALGLIGNYVSFALSAATIGPLMLRGQRFDVVMVYAPSPITQAISGVVVARLKRARLVTWVQDLWPESLSSTGFVRNRTLLGAVERMVRWIYARNDLLLGQSRSFVTAMRELAGGRPVEYFPNPGETGLSAPEAQGAPHLRLDPGFNVVFAGNLGSVQALDTLLDAAELLRDQPEIRFVLIGSGSRGAHLQAEIARRGLSNVQMPGRYAPEDMAPILAQASVLVVSLIRSPIMAQTIPAKVQAYLASGRPIIAALDGEGARVVVESGAGLAVPAEDPRALAGAVARLQAASAEERDRMGAAGRRFYAGHFAPEVLARQLLGRFRTLVASGGSTT